VETLKATLSLLNLKGGVGKTVSIVGLAIALVRLTGNRVLLIDADPQGGLTRWTTAGDPKRFKRNLGSVIFGHHDLTEAIIALDDPELHSDDPARADLWKGVSLLPCTKIRIVVDAAFGGEIDYLALRKVIQSQIPDDIVFVLVDVGHGDNDSSRLGVVASDIAVTVVAAWQYQSVYQLGPVNKMIKDIRATDGMSHVHLGGAIVTGFDESKATHRHIVDGLRGKLGDNVWGIVPWRADIERAIKRNRPLTAMPSRINPVPEVYENIARTALSKITEKGQD
jgi:cellulose biosynthesis protein BcsQ